MVVVNESRFSSEKGPSPKGGSIGPLLIVELLVLIFAASGWLATVLLDDRSTQWEETQSLEQVADSGGNNSLETEGIPPIVGSIGTRYFSGGPIPESGGAEPANVNDGALALPETLPSGGPIENGTGEIVDRLEEEYPIKTIAIDEAAQDVIIDRLKLNLEDYGLCDEELMVALESCCADASNLPVMWPVKGIITSGFGIRVDPITRRRTMHKGLDIYAPTGTFVLAPADGYVKITGWQSGYGRVVYLDHGNGLTTRYAHFSAFLVRKRMTVMRGDPIGKIGSSGRATGPHLHFEVRWRGKALNPRPFLLFDNDQYK